MRRRTIAKIVIAVLVVASVAYVAFKDDIAQFWDGLHVKLAGISGAEENRLARPERRARKSSAGSITPTRERGPSASPMNGSWRWSSRRFRRCSSPRSVRSAIPPISIATASFRIRSSPARQALPIGFAHGGPMLDPTGEPWRNPTQQAGHDRHRPDLRGLSHRPVHLQGHRRHHRRRTGADRSPQVEAGDGRLAAARRGILPGRFGRFADRILGPDSTLDERETLKYQIDQVLKQYERQSRSSKSASPPRASWKATDGSTR